MSVVLALFAAYLLGGVPTGLLLARARGVDLRAVGSGNIGAANAARALGRRAGLLVLLGDAGKGVVAVLLARAAGAGPWGESAAALAAVAGHVWSPYLGLRGGKGVATTLGGFAPLEPGAAALGLCAFAVAYGHARIAAVGSLLGVAAAALWAALHALVRPHAYLGMVLLALVLATHRGNLRRLRDGAEPRG